MKDSLETSRHSLSHILAASVMKLYPKTKLGIGPAIDDGFYYDFETAINQSDLEKIEQEMRSIIADDFTFDRHTATPDEAKKLLSGQTFKLELLNDLKGEISFYDLKNGKMNIFSDLCAGPHVATTADLRQVAFKLDRVAGAYWRGDEGQPMLTRIYGLAFETQDLLDEHLKNREEAKKRDHRIIGKELGLFVFSDLVGPGLPLYTPKGASLRNAIADYSRELREAMGYEEVLTPNINKAELFKTSGHYDKYKDDMLEVTSHYTKEKYYLKPMNCPQHIEIFRSRLRSYKDLPVRFADFATLYRDEKPGELSGLLRLRAFSQDDGHCFCREDQIEHEFEVILDSIKQAMEKYGMKYYIRLSLRDPKKPEKYLGDDKVWDKSEALLEKILKEKNMEYQIGEGEAAFYGPKMDLISRDSLGREWQLSTIQVDFNMPMRFKLEYIDESGNPAQPVMIHSALIGSPERFMGILIEHFAGRFPYWLAPTQIKLITVNDKVADYLKKVVAVLPPKTRYEIDERNETLSRKIREAEMDKVPVILILGPKDAESQMVSVRSEGKEDKVEITKLADFVSKL